MLGKARKSGETPAELGRLYRFPVSGVASGQARAAVAITLGPPKYPLGHISRPSMQFPENCNYDTLPKQNHAPCRRERAPCDAVVATGRWDRSVRNHTSPAAERDQVDHLDCGQR